MMNWETIDTIISILLDKWYVRCNFDGFEKKHFEYIEQNLDNILSDYRNLFSEENKLKNEEIDLERYITFIFLDSEDNMEYNCQKNTYILKKRKTEEYDLLINLKRKTIPQVLAIYWIK